MFKKKVVWITEIKTFLANIFIFDSSDHSTPKKSNLTGRYLALPLTHGERRQITFNLGEKNNDKPSL